MPIELTIKNYRCFVAPVTITVAKDLTAFVGVNNAGKSALMRFLVEFRELFSHLSNDGNIAQIINGHRPSFNPRYALDPTEVFSNLNEHGITIVIKLDGSVHDPTMPTKVDIHVRRDNRAFEISFFNEHGRINLNPPCARVSPGVLRDNANSSLTLNEFISLMEFFARTLYIGAFRNAINVGGGDYFDIAVGGAFISQFQNLRTGRSKKESTAIETLTEQIRDIFKFRSLSIDASDDRQSLHLTVNGRPYKDKELGSGLTQFILVLANAAIKQPKLILIDEPELNLHPRLQLTFLLTFASYADATWFATHSIGLALLIHQK
jgi:AAA15 family ATPase/GTPase